MKKILFILSMFIVLSLQSCVVAVREHGERHEHHDHDDSHHDDRH